MKRHTLLALGVAGSLACSAATATTYLCTTDPSDVSYKACAEFDARSFVTMPSIGLLTEPSSADIFVVAEPAFVTRSSIESRADDALSSEFWTLPGTAVTYEPAVVTYHYGFDSAVDNIR
jgi:hypothetical protein